MGLLGGLPFSTTDLAKPSSEASSGREEVADLPTWRPPRGGGVKDGKMDQD